MLVVDDEFFVRELLQSGLTEQGFVVRTAASGAEALAMVNRDPFDLLLLDVVMGDMDGVTLCRRIRSRHQVPIVMLTAKRELDDVVAGLESGADDYIVKPFKIAEVIARVRAHLRRAQELSRKDDAAVIHVGPLTIDESLQDVLISGSPARLTQKEFTIIKFLAARAGRAVEKDVILEHVWGLDEERSEKILAVYIRRLRRKLEENPDEPRILQTVRGFGYKLSA